MPLKATEILDFNLKQLRRYKDPGSFWIPIFDLHWSMAFSGHFDLARDVIELFFSARPKRFSTNLHRELQTIWEHAPSTKPTNLPSWWPRDTEPYPRVSEVRWCDVFDPVFYMAWETGVESWEKQQAAAAPIHGPWERHHQPRMELFDSRDDWIAAIRRVNTHRSVWEFRLSAPNIDLTALDPHFWRESTDHRHIAACARALCRVPRGEVPTREVMEEAYSAMKRLWDLPFAGVYAKVPEHTDPDQPPIYFDVVFPSKVFLWFCVRLGHLDTATAFLQDIVPTWGYPEYLAAGFSGDAEFYKFCLKEGGFLNLITREGAEECLDVMRQLKQLRPPRNPRPLSPPPAFTQFYSYQTLKNIVMAQEYDANRCWNPILNLYWKLAFSGHLTAARSILEAFLSTVTPDILPSNDELPILRTIWAYAPAAQPSNVPAHWPASPPIPPAASVPERNIFHPSFYSYWNQLNTRRNQFRSMLHHPTPPPPPEDPHSWRTATYTRDCGACARLLCRVPDGEVPTREVLEEAFEAMERARMVSAWPGCDAFEVHVPEPVYFAFCVGLGRWERVREMFVQHTGSYARDPRHPLGDHTVDHREWREVYELIFGEEGEFAELITAEEAELCLELVLKEGFGGAARAAQGGEQEQSAGNTDPVQGLVEVPSEDMDGGSTGDGGEQPAEKQASLQDLLEMPWKELLRRFSESAFVAHNSRYRALPNPPKKASDILLPPITPSVLAEVEERLGRLPPDLRAMVVVANGFRGHWHLFGGGFPPIQKFEVDVCDENWLSFMGDALGDEEPEEEGKNAPIWIAFGGTEWSDDFNHIICPAETWRKLVGDGHETAGEYRVTYTAHWESDGDGFKSMREWLATETLEMEDLIAKRERGEVGGESDAEDGSDMEEGSDMDAED